MAKGTCYNRLGPPGLAVHHLVRARICIERGRLWQAEYWISEARNQALSLACLHRGLPTSYGRGFDDLPAEILEPLANALKRGHSGWTLHNLSNGDSSKHYDPPLFHLGESNTNVSSKNPDVDHSWKLS